MEGSFIKNREFIRQAALLSASSVLLNLISMGFRIFLSGKLGAEGMGLYTLTISVFGFAATVANSGVGLGVTRLCSEREREPGAPRRVLGTGMVVSVCLGCLAALGLFLLSGWAGVVVQDSRVTTPLKVLAPCLPFASASACLSAYFMAKRRADLTVRWQFFEQGVQILLIALLLSLMPGLDMPGALAAVLLGQTVGEAVAWGYGMMLYDKHRDQEKERSRMKVLYPLFRIACPVALSSYFRSGLMTLENFLIPWGLSALSGREETAMAQYGMLKGMAMPVLNFPAALIGAVATLLLPEVASAFAGGDKRRADRLCSTAIRGVFIYAIGVTLFLIRFGEPLGLALYGSAEAGVMIRILAPAVPLLYLDTAADSLLKARDEQMASLWYNTAEGISRILLLIWLLPRYGVSGFILVVFCSNFLSGGLGLVRLVRTGKMAICPMNSLVKPLLFGAGLAELVFYLTRGLAGSPALFCTFGFFLFTAAYAAVLWATGALGDLPSFAGIKGGKQGKRLA